MRKLVKRSSVNRAFYYKVESTKENIQVKEYLCPTTHDYEIKLAAQDANYIFNTESSKLENKILDFVEDSGNRITRIGSSDSFSSVGVRKHSDLPAEKDWKETCRGWTQTGYAVNYETKKGLKCCFVVEEYADSYHIGYVLGVNVVVKKDKSLSKPKEFKAFSKLCKYWFEEDSTCAYIHCVIKK